MDEYESSQVMLSIVFTLILGFIALYSAKVAKDNNKSIIFNYKKNARIVGYLLIAGAVFQAIGLLLVH